MTTYHYTTRNKYEVIEIKKKSVSSFLQDNQIFLSSVPLLHHSKQITYTGSYKLQEVNLVSILLKKVISYIKDFILCF